MSGVFSVYISIFTVDEPRLERVYVDEFSDAERTSYLKKFENNPELIKVVTDLDIRSPTFLVNVNSAQDAKTIHRNQIRIFETRLDKFSKECPTDRCNWLLRTDDGSRDLSGAGDLGRWDIDYLVTADLAEQKYKFYSSFAKAVAREELG
jgi:hypothetical protein